MSIDAEIYEKIRQLKEEGIYGKKTIAKKLGVSKNTVKKYWDGSHVPWVRKEGSGLTKTIVTPEILEFINNCLTEDKDAPKNSIILHEGFMKDLSERNLSAEQNQQSETL